MKTALIILGSLTLLGAVILIIGKSLPVKHRASRTIRLNSPPSRVWRTITDFKGSTLWRKELKSVEYVEVESESAWKETTKSGEIMTFVTLEAIPEKKLVRKIADKDLPFGGSWTFDLLSDNHATILTIVEDGEVYSPFFRFMSRYIFGHHSTIDKYMKNLRAHLEGE